MQHNNVALDQPALFIHKVWTKTQTKVKRYCALLLYMKLRFYEKSGAVADTRDKTSVNNVFHKKFNGFKGRAEKA